MFIYALFYFKNNFRKSHPDYGPHNSRSRAVSPGIRMAFLNFRVFWGLSRWSRLLSADPHPALSFLFFGSGQPDIPSFLWFFELTANSKQLKQFVFSCQNYS